MHRIIIAGSRTFNNYPRLHKELKNYISKYNLKPEEIEIISGTARGADKLGENFARVNGIKCVRFPADWNTYGKSAGYIRNAEMAKYASQEHGVLFAFWDGKSKGTKHMIDLATKYHLEIYVIKEEMNGGGEDGNSD